MVMNCWLGISLDWWIVISQLVVSVVALGIAATPPLWRRFRGPKIIVVTSTSEPHQRQDVALGSRSKKAIFLRLEVQNVGHSAAHTIEVYADPRHG